MRTEGLAMRAGPRPRLEEGLLPLLREALTVGRVVEFKYRAGEDGGQESAARRAVRGALRKPGVPRRSDRLDGRAATLAARQGA